MTPTDAPTDALGRPLMENHTILVGKPSRSTQTLGFQKAIVRGSGEDKRGPFILIDTNEVVTDYRAYPEHKQLIHRLYKTEACVIAGYVTSDWPIFRDKAVGQILAARDDIRQVGHKELWRRCDLYEKLFETYFMDGALRGL